MSEEYKRIKERLIRNRQLFEDPEFPASKQSIDKNSFVSSDIEWKRPGELSRNPVFILESTSRYDLYQGELGDCWFIAGTACVAITNRRFLDRVVPSDQSFQTDYAGIFRFNFYRFDKWVEVLVDDRIPTRSGRPIFGHNRGDTNEYWVALIEKAYAKLNGGYYKIDGGFLNDAVVDLTGGVSERLDLDKNKDTLEPILYELMQKTSAMSSMMGVSIDSDRIGETELANGLYMGHAYSVTKVATVTALGREVKLVRLRNPWGNGEWKGAWGDSSSLWQNVSDADKRRIGLTSKNEGEFWIDYYDMMREFTDMAICHLYPDALTKEVAIDMEKRNWQVNKHHGEWLRGFSAGGNGNPPYENLFWTNPQYSLTLTEEDDADGDGKCTMVVSLMQKPQQTKDNLFISFTIYKLRYREPVLLNGENYEKKSLYLYKQPEVFKNLRESTGQYRVDPGTYVIIPATWEPNTEGKFFLRIYTETEARTEVIDEPTVIEKPVVETGDNTKELFDKYAGTEKRLDASELQNLLGEHYKSEIQRGFGIEVCRNLVAMMDTDASGLIDFDEFKRMLKELNVWQGAFVSFDSNRSGSIDSNELEMVFKAIGFKLSRNVLSSIIRRYGGKSRQLVFEDFIQCCTKIMVMYTVFNNRTKESDTDKVELSLEEWLSITMLY